MFFSILHIIITTYDRIIGTSEYELLLKQYLDREWLSKRYERLKYRAVFRNKVIEIWYEYRRQISFEHHSLNDQ